MPDAGIHMKNVTTVRWLEIGGVGLATLAAWLLRWPQLETIPPGLWVDEAIHGLQGLAGGMGERLPDLPQMPYPTWPVWWGLEVISTRVLGATVEAIRAPAALIGTLTVPLAWWVVRVWTGPVGGVAAAWLVAGSFWHVQFSRMALEPILLPAEGLVVGWLILAPRWAGSVAATAFAGFLSGGACYGYAAALYLPLWGIGAVVIEPVHRRRRFIAFFAGLLLALMPLFVLGKARLARPATVGIVAPAALVQSALSTIANLAVSIPHIHNGYWENHPAGAARLSWIERLTVLVGVVVLFAAPRRWAMLCWLPLALSPEIAPAGLHLFRSLGALAPLALLAGFAGRRLGTSIPRYALAVVVALGTWNALLTAHHYYRTYATDPAVKGWFISVDTETANILKGLCREAPIEVQPELTYAGWPTIRFLVMEELRAGHIRVAAGNPPFTRIVAIARHAVHAQPTMFVYGTDGYPKDRRIGLLNIAGLLAPGRDAEMRGDLSGAERYYRHVLTLVPDAGLAHARLGLVLFKLGHRSAASRELLQSVALGVGDAEVNAALAACQPNR